MSHAIPQAQLNSSTLEAEIQCGSHAGVCHAYATLLFYTVVMVAQKEEIKRLQSASEVGR
ncbi:TPA: hypothetical protein ACGD2I_003770 [Aeromonas hydrophila]|uniref:hypothetical protein n=1 Tax=Aeromonas hydrophila TaxID=644 RepID=UPI00107E7B66|nr:hypothetical protein [Aeromonas hydrophila]MCV3294768.1 hypothetical protein [Aeromonas hydrophila]QBX70051.1 hypothetical protein E4625_03765 [Aeromonas hydrophila]QBX74782.1 hypothetical protein E4630_03765 [Aeromonas hydrophila]WDA25179.1 hypothetical protein PSC74_01910 [Aeromonas hydrophila]WES95234.1 hypothetical protein PY368_10560 [Aeromonas hydrophila]